MDEVEAAATGVSVHPGVMVVIVDVKEEALPLAEEMSEEKEKEMHCRHRLGPLPQKEAHQDQVLHVQMVAALFHSPHQDQL
jgi:hypothetical protein